MKPSMTQLRKEILSQIKNSVNPLSAKEILDTFLVKPDFSTIYRALDYLEKNSLIQSVTFNETTRFYFSCGHGHCHFVYCEKCHKAKEFHKCFEKQLVKEIETETGFKITGHSFFFTGVCNNCKTQA